MDKIISIQSESITLYNSIQTPAFLFGTKGIDLSSMQLILNNGFFSFDMAAVYNTDNIVFSSIKNFLSEQITLSRDKFYFLYKLDATKLLPQQITNKTEELLNAIGSIFPNDLPYIDMLVIHSPNHDIPIQESWLCLEKLKISGKAKALGVSNFNLHHLQCMHKLGLSTPMLNQIEMNPFFSQNEMAKYCLQHQIKISAFRSKRNKASPADIQLLNQIAQELRLSPIQVINSWKYTMGYQIVSISFNPNHINELKEVICLEEPYMQMLSKMDKGEEGRTCQGDWSRFDFNDQHWSMYAIN